MKKVILFIVFMLLTVTVSEAAVAKKISLNKGSIYLLLLDEEPTNFKISNPNIMQVQIIPTLENNKKQVLIQALNYGNSLFEAQTSSNLYKYDCKITDGALTIDEDIFEIEKPKNEDLK